jgi:hypothetical protein
MPTRVGFEASLWDGFNKTVFTWTGLTCPAGTTLAILCLVSTHNLVYSDVTWDSVSGTEILRSGQDAMWVLKNPNVGGSKTLEVTRASSTGEQTAFIAWIKEAHAVSPIGDSGSGTTTVQLTPVTAVDMVISMARGAYNNQPDVSGGHLTLWGQGNHFNVLSNALGYRDVAPDPTDATWDANSLNTIAAVIQAPAGGHQIQIIG